MLDLEKSDQIYLATGKLDLRKEADGLAVVITEKFFQKTLFLFCGSCGLIS
jgi:hypothetical protein